MRKSIYIVILAIMGLSSCSSQKKLQTNPPFEIEGPTCQKWTGGREESGSGLEVKIPISQIKDENIALQELYFRGKITTIINQIIDGERYAIGKFSQDKLQKPDIIMHSDSTKEVGNQPPKLSTKDKIEFPFELKEDEAVISYIDKEGATIKYAKITGIKDIQPLLYSSKPKN